MPTMTLRERTLAAINHQTPDRVAPYVMGIQQWEAYMKHVGVPNIRQVLDDWGIGTNRFPVVDPVYRGPAKKDKQGNPADMWGAPGWAPTYASAIPRPLAGAETVAEVDAHDWPDPALLDLAPLIGALKGQADLLRMNRLWTPVFCELSALFGMDQALLNMHLNPALIEAALAHVDAYYTGYFQRVFQECGDLIDIFAVGDDFADNRGLLMRPEQWRRFFKPLWAKWLAMAKARGLRTWMHACGAISAVLPDLVDIGLEVWEAVQTHLPGNEPERLKRDFGRHLTFAGGVDTQHVLSFMPPDEVRRRTREAIRVLGVGGGYLCGPDHWVQPGVPFENVTALFETVREFRGEGCTL